MEMIGWIATGLILIGYYLNARKLTSSWVSWFIGNFLMVLYSLSIQAWPQLVLAMILMGLNVYGYIKWITENE
tara:strand:+ start:300 stop:518 length:219 start_codon:yes stop_codon:yes gene_type:complete